MNEKEIWSSLAKRAQEANANWIVKADAVIFAAEEEATAKLEFERCQALLDSFLAATVDLGIAEDPLDEVRHLSGIVYVSQMQ